MKQSKLLVPTLREIPSDAEIKSHQLLVKAGYIRQLSNGFYAYLPLAHRVLMKIVSIIRNEFEKLDSFEMMMPNLLPISYHEDECENVAKGSLFSVNDSNGKEYMLAPTHEKVFLDLIKKEVQSYRKLPLNLYQIQMKYRDEKKPKNGLMLSREFLMADLYSFHLDDNELEKNFQQFESAFKEIFIKCGLTAIAANGALDRPGVSKIREFVVPAEFGTQRICYATESDYAADIQVAISEQSSKRSHATYLDLEKIPASSMIDAANKATFISESVDQVIHSLFYYVNNEPYLFLIRGDHELNISKVKLYFQTRNVRSATENETIDYFGVGCGYIGPVNSPKGLPIYADLYVSNMVNAICGSNEEKFLLKNVNVKRDFSVKAFVDFHMVKEGEVAPNNQGLLKIMNAIEVAQLMKLDSTYTENLSGSYLNEQGELTPFSMGYYRIAVSRMLAMIVEQYADSGTISWPRAIAPFFVHILPMDYSDLFQKKLTEEVLEKLELAHYEVLVDDRDERPGVKFADSELIGCPVRITVGKKARDGVVEIMILESRATIEVRKEEIIATLAILLQS